MDREERKGVHSERTLKEILALVDERNRTLLAISKIIRDLPKDGNFDQFDYERILRVKEMEGVVEDITEKLHVE